MKKQFISLQKFKLTTGQIDRRQFVMSALAAGVVLPSALSMADKAMAAAPKKGGMMRYGVGPVLQQIHLILAHLKIQ